MIENENDNEIEIALLKQCMEGIKTKTDDIHTAIIGTNGTKGLITRMNLCESSGARLWWLASILAVFIGGILTKLVIF